MVTPDMFPKPPRRKPRVLMHVIDAGNSCMAEFPMWTRFQCSRCDHKAEFVFDNKTEAMRRQPCPKCNESGIAALKESAT